MCVLVALTTLAQIWKHTAHELRKAVFEAAGPAKNCPTTQKSNMHLRIQVWAVSKSTGCIA